MQFAHPKESTETSDDQKEDQFRIFDRVQDLDWFLNEARQMRDPDCLLKEPAFEKLLDLGLAPDSGLSRRLLEVAQVRKTKTKTETTTGALTCYELLALYSLLRYGDQEQLVEFVFCVFDVDGDDRASAADIEKAIGWLVEFGVPLAGKAKGDGDDGEALEKLEGVAKEKAVREIAEDIVKRYGADSHLAGPSAETPVVEAPVVSQVAEKGLGSMSQKERKAHEAKLAKEKTKRDKELKKQASLKEKEIKKQGAKGVSQEKR